MAPAKAGNARPVRIAASVSLACTLPDPAMTATYGTGTMLCVQEAAAMKIRSALLFLTLGLGIGSALSSLLPV